MRPIRLEMTAFGSYKEKTIINFDRLSGLFLVTGDTGAGKTTIFDAIVYSLYGGLSGSDSRDRTPEMMHCDRVPKSIDTEVSFEFEQDGKNYRVDRTLHFSKVRGSSKENPQYGTAKQDAVLYEPADVVKKGLTVVNSRCIELIGFDKNQFCQVVMLAQGEFQRFLKANSEERSDILGKIFDNSIYVRYQEYFKRAADKLEKLRSSNMMAIETQLENVFLTPKDSSYEFLAGDKELLDKFSELIREEENSKKEDDKKYEEESLKKNVIITKITKAENDNKDLKSLEENKKKLEELKIRIPEIEKLKNKKEKISNIKYIISVERDKYTEAKASLDKTREDIELYTAKSKKLDSDLKEAELIVEKDDEDKKKIEELSNEIAAIKKTIPDYDSLSLKQSELEKEKKDSESLDKKKAEYKEELEKISISISTKEKEIEGINDLQQNKADVDKKIIEISKVIEVLKKAREDISDITTLSDQLTIEQKKSLKLNENVRVCYEKYYELNRLFLENYSSILGNNLRLEVEEKGEAVCPVCHSHIVKGDLLISKVETDKIITEDEVKKAEKKYNDSNDLLNNQKSLLEGIKERLEEKKDNLLKTVDGVIDFKDYDDLIRNEAVINTLSDKKEEKERLDKELKKIEEDIISLDKLKDKVKEERNLIEKIRQDSEKNDSDILKVKNSISALEEAIKQLKSKLEYESKGEADEMIKKESKEKDDLFKKVKENEDRLKALKEEASKINGLLDKEKKEEPLLLSRAESSKESFDKVIKENGFDTWNEVEEFLLMSNVSLEKAKDWIDIKDKEINDFNNEYTGVSVLVNELREKTNGLEYTDISGLEELLSVSEETINSINDHRTDLKNLIENHRKVFEKIRENREALRNTDNSYNLLKRLSDLSNGSNSDGGQLTFERYVMGAVFDEIVRASNIRLDTMSNGRYSLVHNVDAKRRTEKAGLLLAVLDNSSGAEREAASLSGGESFLVSMSLALGLSDIVRQHAGGRSLNCLFIDEGFGTLDDEKLDNAIEVLNTLSQGKDNLVGIISHVDKLYGSIDQKLIIRSTDDGSKVTMQGIVE